MRRLPLLDDLLPADAQLGDRQLGASPSSKQDQERRILLRKYQGVIAEQPDLTRKLVSYQGNKGAPFYRWFSYKEAFSASLVTYVLAKFQAPGRNHVLDPFAGAGTTLTAARGAGHNATGLELLPVGAAFARARILGERTDPSAFEYQVRRLTEWAQATARVPNGYRFPHLAITRQAFPEETEAAFAVYRHFLQTIDDNELRYLFWFAWLSVLEEVSYTRKDGQYLRWDARSGRHLRSTFHKGKVSGFWPAVNRRLSTMLSDLRPLSREVAAGQVRIVDGSCLEELPTYEEASFDLIITSPPYCNRYDYTRTYALELAFMGYAEEAVKRLRQALLSATVENRAKQEELSSAYHQLGCPDRYAAAVRAFETQPALQEVLDALERARYAGSLNNSNIPRMVRNYFFEMNLVIHEMSRILRAGGYVVMVNDNVRYNGEEVPVDLILTDLAEQAGLEARHIWVLPRGKGNSSQQMGAFGRQELRKCVYVWRKT